MVVNVKQHLRGFINNNKTWLIRFVLPLHIISYSSTIFIRVQDDDYTRTSVSCDLAPPIRMKI
jgi:hypothetical protein